MVRHDVPAGWPVAAPLIGTLLVLLAACGGGAVATPTPAAGGATPPPAASQPGSTVGSTEVPVATQAPAGETRPCKLITNDEAEAVIGVPVDHVSSAEGIVDIWIGPLKGCGFVGAKAANGSAPALSVAIVPNGKDQFEEVKSKTPNATVVGGVGDEAFASDQGGVGKPPFLVGALKGTTAVYLYTFDGSSDAALQALLLKVVPRI